MHRSCAAPLAAFLSVAFVPAFTQSMPKQAEVSERAKRTLRAFLQTFDAELKDRFVAALTDLNGDGSPEGIVYLTSNVWCGTGGCTMLILEQAGGSWRLLTKASITRPPIRVLGTKSNGWRDVGVWCKAAAFSRGTKLNSVSTVKHTQRTHRRLQQGR